MLHSYTNELTLPFSMVALFVKSLGIVDLFVKSLGIVDY